MIEKNIQVMKHFADGGRVESKAKRTTHWEFDRVPTWNFEERHYRIEPRVFYLAISLKSNEIMSSSANEADLAFARANPNEFEIIEVKEQPKDVKQNTAVEPAAPPEHPEG